METKWGQRRKRSHPVGRLEGSFRVEIIFERRPEGQQGGGEGIVCEVGEDRPLQTNMKR